MAEILGTVAAAVQLVQAGLQLKKLCSQIKDMPNEIAVLVDEVEVLTEMLGDIQKHHAADYQTLADDNMWRRCLQQLQTSVDSIGQVNSNLTTLLQKHRVMGTLRVFLKRDELSKCREKLERAKSAMILAQQTYSFALLAQQNQLLLHEIRDVAFEQKSLVRTIQHNAIVPVPSQSPQHQQVVDSRSMIQTHKSVRQNREEPHRRLTLRIQAPRWIIQVGLQVLVRRNNHSWGISFRTYNRRSNESELFRYARQGHWRAVQQMFIEGRASPFDVDEQDTTLLSIAVLQMDYEACKVLSNHGVDPTYRDSLSQNAFFQLAYIVMRNFYEEATETTTQSSSDIVLLLAESCSGGDRDIVEEETLAYVCCLQAEALAPVIRLFAPSYEAVDPGVRAGFASVSHTTDYRTIHLLLGNDQTLRQAFQLLPRSSSSTHRMLLLQTAEQLGRLNRPGIQNAFQVHGWMSILSEIVAYEAESRGGHQFYSCIVGFLMGYFGILRMKHRCYHTYETLNHALTAVTRIWIRLLKEAGADLLLYGQTESDYIRSVPGRHVMFRIHHDVEYAIRLEYLVYGPEVMDWHLFVVPVYVPTCINQGRFTLFPGVSKFVQDDLYSLAGEFWSLIENPEIYGIPGAFIPDAGDADGSAIGGFITWAPVL